MERSESYFVANAKELRLLGNVDLPRGRPNIEGTLRRPQVAAAFAVAAHFSTGSDPAIVSMPTGSGKSGAMTLLPFLLSARRVMIVTPSRLLRSQLHAEVAHLRVLTRAGVVPAGLLPPRTVEVATRRGTEADWLELVEADVIVGTPNVFSPTLDGICAPPPELVDLVIFDEAHHTPAQSYSAIMHAFPDAHIALFTATPFRRDRKHLPGANVYTFSLAQALEEGILAPISFKPVELDGNATQEQRDLALARAAKARFDLPEHRAADSRIIARTATVEHAKELVNIYASVSLSLGLITASTSASKVRKTLAAVGSGDHAGLISVGVLGEGFDFPTLKIGVYHQRHASLAPTLQFLGRISRVLPAGVPGELLAVRDSISDETHDLYSSDVAWAELVPAIADAATSDEAERRSYVRSFDPLPQDPLSVAALRPRKDVQIFDVSDAEGLDLRAEVLTIGDGEVAYHGADAEDRLAVFITEHLERPEWLDADALDRFRYELHVVYFDPEHDLVFVHGTRDTTIAELLRRLGCTGAEFVDPLWIDQLLTSIAVAGYHSVGMRSARAAGGRLAAYRMMAGTSVGGAVSPSETRSYGTGHTIARVYDPMKVTAKEVESQATHGVPITSLGVSYGRAKVFSPDLAPILEFRKWCERLAFLVESQSGTNPSGPPALQLYSPRRMDAFPEFPYLALVEPGLIGRGLQVLDPGTGVIADLETVEFAVERKSDTALEVIASCALGRWSAIQDIRGHIENPSDTWQIVGSGDDDSLDAFLESNPLTIFYPSGASSMGAILFQPRPDYSPIGENYLSALEFDKTDIRAEHKGARPGLMTVRERIVKDFAGVADWIVLDDRSGEIADLVIIKDQGLARPLDVTLMHLKASSKDNIGVRVEDLYEVLGQASRSVVWCDGQRWASRLIERLTTGSAVVSGDPDTLSGFLATQSITPRPVKWTIGVVQSGLRASGVNSSSNAKTMLNDLVEWVTQHDCDVHIYGHSDT